MEFLIILLILNQMRCIQKEKILIEEIVSMIPLKHQFQINKIFFNNLLLIDIHVTEASQRNLQIFPTLKLKLLFTSSSYLKCMSTGMYKRKTSKALQIPCSEQQQENISTS